MAVCLPLLYALTPRIDLCTVYYTTHRAAIAFKIWLFGSGAANTTFPLYYEYRWKMWGRPRGRGLAYAVTPSSEDPISTGKPKSYPYVRVCMYEREGGDRGRTNGPWVHAGYMGHPVRSGDTPSFALSSQSTTAFGSIVVVVVETHINGQAGREKEGERRRRHQVTKEGGWKAIGRKEGVEIYRDVSRSWPFAERKAPSCVCEFRSQEKKHGRREGKGGRRRRDSKGR